MKIGLISDTHIPDRWRVVPDVVFEVFRDVDFVLHAGDVGDLEVLTHLATLAPVFAVHGNDDSVTAMRELSYQQVIQLNGYHRLLLAHSHEQDHAKEMAERKIDIWPPKLARLANWAKRVEATLFVYGHTHIPMAREFDGVWLINPGAIASGGHSVKQVVQSVALLTIEANQPPMVEHIAIHQGEPEPLTFKIDWDGGFQAAFRQTNTSIVSPALQALLPDLRKRSPRRVTDILRELAFPLWEGERDTPIQVEEVQARL